MVLADVGTLATLSDRDFRSGLAEVAKYALTLDTGLLEHLESDPDRCWPAIRRHWSARSAVRGGKAALVAGDERDTGARLVLNYGHTLGHALERLDCVRRTVARRGDRGGYGVRRAAGREARSEPTRGSRRGRSGC